MDQMVSIILSIVFIVMCLAFIVGVLELSTPVILKGDFDRICDSYVDVAVDGGGLTVAQTNSLIADLEQLATGVTVTSTDISRAGTVSYKGSVSFKVEATYSRSSIVGMIVRQTKTYPFVYQKTFAHSKFIVD